MMETYYGHVRTPADAIILFEACRIGLLPRVQRRLSEKERQLIRSGSVFVWDEREAGMRRWTDGKSWSASRVSGSFLTYREMEGKRSGGGSSGGAGERRRGGGGREAGGAQVGGDGFPSAVPATFTLPFTSAAAAAVAAQRHKAGKTPDSMRGGSDSDADMPDDNEDTYRYKPDGLVKQSFSITTANGQHLHLISYYARSHPAAHLLMQPSNDPGLRQVRPQKGLYPDSTLHEPQHVSLAGARSPFGALSAAPHYHPHHRLSPSGATHPRSYAASPYAWPPSPVATPPLCLPPALPPYHHHANGSYHSAPLSPVQAVQSGMTSPFQYRPSQASSAASPTAALSPTTMPAGLDHHYGTGPSPTSPVTSMPPPFPLFRRRSGSSESGSPRPGQYTPTSSPHMLPSALEQQGPTSTPLSKIDPRLIGLGGGAPLPPPSAAGPPPPPPLPPASSLAASIVSPSSLPRTTPPPNSLGGIVEAQKHGISSSSSSSIPGIGALVNGTGGEQPSSAVADATIASSTTTTFKCEPGAGGSRDGSRGGSASPGGVSATGSSGSGRSGISSSRAGGGVGGIGGDGAGGGSGSGAASGRLPKVEVPNGKPSNFNEDARAVSVLNRAFAA